MLIDHSPDGAFQGQWHQMMKQKFVSSVGFIGPEIMQMNKTWWKIPIGGRQLAIYKHGRGVQLGCTGIQLQQSGQSGTWTCSLRLSSLEPEPLHQARPSILTPSLLLNPCHFHSPHTTMNFFYSVALTIMPRAFYDGRYVLWGFLMG